MNNRYNMANLQVFQTKKKRIKIQLPIIRNGKKHLTAESVDVEWVDMDTGEILSKSDVTKLGLVVYDYGIMVLQREYILNSLRKELKEFALFVLEFRNQRRGITPGIDELCRWYAELKGQKHWNVKRMVSKLVQAGILSRDNNDVMMPLFQLKGTGLTSKAFLTEMREARSKFTLLKIKADFLHFLDTKNLINSTS